MRNNEFDTKLIIYRSRQVFLILAVMVMTGVFTSMILKNEGSDFPWFVLAMPITGLGLFFLVIPPTEEWQYKPWQGKSRRIEQQER